MSKLLIVFATQKEASATIDLLEAIPVIGHQRTIWPEEEATSLYSFEKGWIALSSIGIANAQMTIAQHAHLVDEVWNLGLAGGLQEKHCVGDLLSIHNVGKYIPLEIDRTSFLMGETANPWLSLHSPLKEASLLSSDFPIHDARLRSSLQKKWDLVDMEGYGVAFAAHYFEKKCRMWKVISDFARIGGRDLIKQHIVELSYLLANKVKEELSFGK